MAIYDPNKIEEEIAEQKTGFLPAINKAISTINDVTFNVTRGMAQRVEGIADFLVNATGIFGDENYKNKIKEWVAQDNSEKIAEFMNNYLQMSQRIGGGIYDFVPKIALGFAGDKSNNWLSEQAEAAGLHNLSNFFKGRTAKGAEQMSALTGTTVGEKYVKPIAQSAGGMIVDAAIGHGIGSAAGAIAGQAGAAATKAASVAAKAQKAAGLASLGVGAGGKATEEAYNDGATYGRGTLYGLAQGGTEVATEMMFDSPINKIYGSGFLRPVASTFGGKFVKELAGEAIEEVASELASPLEKAIYKGKEALSEYGEGDYWKGVGRAGATGALTAGVVGTATGSYSHSNMAADFVNDAQTEITKRANQEANGKLDAKKEAASNKKIQTYMEAAEKNLAKMSEKQRAKFFEDNKGLSTIFTQDGKIRPEFARKTWGGQSAAETANGEQAQNTGLSDSQKRYVSVNARYDGERATNAVKALQDALDKQGKGETAEIYSGELSSEQEETYAVAKRIVNNLNQTTGDDMALIVVGGENDFNALNEKNGNAILISEKTLSKTHGAVDALAKILFEEATHSTQSTNAVGQYTSAGYAGLFYELATGNSATMEGITSRLLADGNGYGFTQEMLEGIESKLDSRENLTEEEKKMLDRINEKDKRGEKLTEKEKELRDRVTLTAKEQELLDEIGAQTVGEILGGNKEIVERYASNKTAAEKILGVFGKIKKALSRANSKEAKAERARVERVEGMLLNALAAKGYTYRNGNVISVRQPEEKENEDVRFAIKTVKGIGKVAYIDEDLIQRKPGQSYTDAVKEYFDTYLSGMEIPVESSGDSVTIQQKKKFFDKASQAKKQAVQILDDIISIGENKVHKENFETDLQGNKKKHTGLSASRGWDYYDTNFEIGDKIFSARVIVRKSGDGIDYFYDLDNIQNRYTTRRTGTESRTTVRDGVPTDNSISQSSENVKPQSEKNLRFSLTIGNDTVTGQVEETKDLVALHNLSEDKLLKVISLGGFPMPSIAVTKPSIPHTGYGDITVVFGRETIDPKADSRNRVYERDAWTPSTPEVAIKLNDEKVENLISKLRKAVDGNKFFVSDIERFFDQIQDNAGEYVLSDYDFDAESFARKAKNYAGMMAAYLSEKGKNVSPIYKERTFMDGTMTMDELLSIAEKIGVTKENIRFFDNAYSKNTPEEAALYQKALDVLAKFYEEKFDKKYESHGIEKKYRMYKEIGFHEFVNYSDALTRVFQDESKKEYDRYETADSLKEQITDQKDFENWIMEQMQGAEEQRGIRNDTDVFTRSGNRRKFSQTHEPYNLQNIIRNMLKGSQVGKGSFLGQNANSLAARLSDEFSSIKDIKEASGLLNDISEEEYEEVKDKSYEMMKEVVWEISGNVSDFSDSMTRKDDILDMLSECALVRPITPEKILASWNKQIRGYEGLGYQFNAETAQKVYDLFSVLKEMPTRYFEAKPRRAVTFDEIKKVLLPAKTSEKLIRALDENNIPYEIYGNTDEERTSALQGMDNIRFSKGQNAGEDTDALEGLTQGQRKKVVANNTMDRVYTRMEATDEINRIVDEVIAKKYGDTVIKGGRQSLVNRYWIDLNKSNGFARDAIARKIADYMIENAMVSQAIEEMSDDASATGEEIAKKAKRIRLDSIDSGELEKMRSQIANELLNSFDRLGSESTFSKNTRRKIKLSIWNSNIAKELQGFVDGKGEYVAADILNAPEMQEWIKTLKPLAGKAIYGKEARKVVEQLSKFYNEDNELLEGYLDKNVEDAVKFILEKKDSKAMLSTEEMEALHKILAGIRRLYKTYDRVTLAGRSVSLTDTAMTAHEQISKARRKATTRSFAGKLKNLFSTEMVEPRVVIEALEGFTDDGILSKAYRDIQNGETRKQILYMQMMYDFDEFMDKNKKYGKRLYKDYIEFHGQKLSVGQAITLHELAKRDQAKLGLSENGFTFDDEKNVKHSIKAITDDELSTLSNQFTEQDKEFIKITEHFFNEVASEIKMEADKENLGYTNALEEFYFPIARDKMTIRKAITDTRSMLQNMISLYSYSFNKDVRKNAKNALYVGNVYDIIKTHAEQLSSYAGLYAPMKSFEQIYGKNIAKNKGLTGVISVRQTLNDNVWDGTDKYISKLMSDISGTTPTEKSEFVEYLRGAYAKFQLGANVKTFLSQIASYPQAFTELDMGSLVKGFATVSNHADMDKYCPYASVRNYNKGIVKAEGVIDKIGKVGDTMTKPIQVFDRFTIGKLWNACQYQVQKDSGLKIGTEENKVKAGAMLEDVIRKTQPDFNTSERSALMRSQSEYARAAVMFTSAQLKQLSRLVESVGKLQYAKTTGDAAKIKAARIQVARSSSAVLMSVTAYAMMGMLAKALFARLKASDKEPEEKFEAIAKEFGADMISGGVGLLPIVRDIYSAISSKAMNNGNGYEINSFYYDVLNNVVNAGYKAGELAVHAMQGKNIEDYQYMSVIRNTTNAVGQLTGVPTRNLYNEITGLIKRVSPSAGYTINSKFYNANYVSDMNKALESGDEQRANTIMNLMMSERMDGTSTSQINKSVLDLYKNGYTVLPRTVGDSITYDGQEYKLTARQKARFQKVYGQASAAVQKVVSLQSYRKLSDDVKAKTIKRIYDMYYNLAIDDLLGTDTEDKTVLFSYAIDPDKLALIIAQAQSLQADVDKNGNAIAGSKKQKVVAYIDGLKLTAAQKYMIMGYLGYRNAKGEEQVKAYINRLPGLSKAEKKTLMEYSGY